MNWVAIKLWVSVMAFLWTTAYAQQVALSDGQTASKDASTLESVIVTATRTYQKVDSSIGDVQVIERAQIEAANGQTLEQLLQMQSDIQMTSSGAMGQSSGIFIRGAETRHTLLLIDGVRYGSVTLGTPIWSTLPLALIERIEILKGPASALYGSDAVGGVVQIFTRSGSKTLKPFVSVGTGSDQYAQAHAGVSGMVGDTHYALGLSRTQTQGFSATNENAAFGIHNSDRDGAQQNALTLNVGHQFSPNWSLKTGLLLSDGDNDFDDGPTVDAKMRTKAQNLHMDLTGKLMKNWTSQWKIAQSKDDSDITAATYGISDYTTKQTQYIWQNDVVTALGNVQMGVERLEQAVDASIEYALDHRNVNGVFAGITGQSRIHHWQLNVRNDDNSQFGSETTWFTGYGLDLSKAWRIHASYGTGFVAPSFNQLYYPQYGNADLQPETSQSMEVGVTFTQGAQRLKLSYFDTKVEGFIASTTIASNIPKARIDGFTLAYDAPFWGLNWHAVWEQLNPRNQTLGKQLPRRAKTVAKLGADGQWGVWGAGFDAISVGQRFDDSANTVVLNGYATLDTRLSYALTPTWNLQAKIVNLTNKNYETAAGYNQMPRSFFITLNYAPKN